MPPIQTARLKRYMERPLRQLRHLLRLLHPQVNQHVELTRMQTVSLYLPDVFFAPVVEGAHQSARQSHRAGAAVVQSLAHKNSLSMNYPDVNNS